MEKTDKEAPLHERELVGLHPLAREIPNIDAAVAEIARFSAELTYPKAPFTSSATSTAKTKNCATSSTTRTPQQQKDYALRMLHELFAVVRLLAARRSLKHATRIFPSEYRELFTEILHAPATGRDRAYVEAIVDALADEGSLLHLIHLTGRVIRNLTIAYRNHDLPQRFLT